METFDNKVAIVTGAASGIGRASALAFARRGAKVALADIQVEEGERTARMIKEAGGQAIFIRTDVSKSDDVKALVDKVVEVYGRLDFAHNNAGIDGEQAATQDYPEEAWNQVIATNLTGVWLGMKYEIQVMMRQGSGSIVNTSSICGVIAFDMISAYVASKFGVIGITKTAALECAGKGIRINAICPGWVDTEMSIREAAVANMTIEEFRAMAAGMVPVKRMGRPEDIAAAAVWLCSDSAAYITGHAMVVDGGMTVGPSFLG